MTARHQVSGRWWKYTIVFWNLVTIGGWAQPAAPAQKSTPPDPLTREEIKKLLELDPALAKELQIPKIRRWDAVVNLTTGLGYKDNVLLGFLQPQASGFARTGLELAYFRLPINGWQYYVYLFGDDLRYFSSAQVKKEQTALALAQVKKDFEDRWQLSLTGQYLYLDQVLDLSTEQGILTPLPVVGHSYSPKLGLRREFGKTNWLEMELNINRQDFDSPLYDYWESGPKITLGHPYRFKSDLSLSYEFNRRIHDNRPQYDADGIPRWGTDLEYDQHKVNLIWRHYFDRQRHWRATTRLALERNRDNATGYFGYWKYQFSEQLRYQDNRWELRGYLRLARYDYPVQKVAFVPPALHERTELSVGIRGEVLLAKEVKFYLEYEHERSISNLALSQYKVNTVNAGFYWEF
jgi:hypothetical protein